MELHGREGESSVLSGRSTILIAVAVVGTMMAAAAVMGLRSPEAPSIIGSRPAGGTSARTFSHPEDAFRGAGVWLSIYDFVPTYQRRAQAPPVSPVATGAMAASGITTLFIQAAVSDPGMSGDGLVDRPALSGFLAAAHTRGLRVVAWFAPTLVDLDQDLARLRALHDFHDAGHRFDAIAIDMERTDGVPDPAERSRRLVELSSRARRAVGAAYPLAAVTIPPVLLDTINPAAWPGFPWVDLADLYDVWIPMGYWTFRGADGPYRDAEKYTTENIAGLRRDLHDPDAVVHVLGGVSDGSDADDYAGFVRAVEAGHAIGGSIFTYRHLSAADLQVLGDGIDPTGLDERGASLHE